MGKDGQMKGLVGAAVALLSGCSAGGAEAAAVTPQGLSNIGGADRVYAGRDINVYFKDNHSGLLVVTFTPRTKEGTPELFGVKYLDKRGISYVAFQALHHHWWQTPEMNEAIGSLRPILSRFKTISTYGASMGAHGALTFSKALGAQRVIASAPQYSIDPALAPWETRWREEAGDLTLHFKNPLEGVSESAEKVIIFDPTHLMDARHAEQFRNVPNTQFIDVPGCGHTSLKGLRSAGALPRFMDALLAPRMQLEVARGIMRDVHCNARGKGDTEEGDED